MNKLIIIGAGASGVYLSYLIKKAEPSLQVIVLEANKTPLKKLLATGNGRCNLSNQDLDPSHYETDAKNKVKAIIDDFDMVEEMKKLGLYTKYLGNLLYPRSEQAKSVMSILYKRATQAGVVFLFEQKVIDIEAGNGYIIKTDKQTFHSDGLVLAMGTRAGRLSNDFNRLDIVKHLHLKARPYMQMLVPMLTDPLYKSLKGVRVKGHFTLKKKETVLHEEDGEMLFTNYGVSGIAIMQCSRYYQKGVSLHCDLVPEYSYEELKDIISHLDTLEGLLPRELCELIGRKKLDPLKTMKDLTFTIKGLRDREFAQVEKGGLLMSNFDEHLESYQYPHLYACGEILNTTGDCGGYNLHFAFASAKAIAKGLERSSHVKN